MYAGIPDFRSPSGIFQSLKRDHPRENITSGRDLFDATVFKVCLFIQCQSHTRFTCVLV